MEFIAMDLIGEFHPASSKGNIFTLTAVCMLTGFMFCIPPKTTCAEDVIKAYIDHICCTFGPSRKILTDNGTKFKNKLWTEVFKKLKIEQKFTPIYSPQCNAFDVPSLTSMLSPTLSSSGSFAVLSFLFPSLVFLASFRLCATTWYSLVISPTLIIPSSVPNKLVVPVVTVYAQNGNYSNYSVKALDLSTTNKTCCNRCNKVRVKGQIIKTYILKHYITVRSAQLVVPTITSSEITSKYIQLQYISEATHQVKIEAHSLLPQWSRT